SELRASLSGFSFSLGAGYTFFTGSRKEGDWKLQRNQYINDLYGNDESKIINAARWLGRESVEEIVPRLVDLLLKDERADVRVSAAVALGLIRDEETLDALTFAAEKDPSSDVRYSALLSISRITPTDKNMESIRRLKNTEKDNNILDYLKNMEEIFK
ncbi:MAG: HEAT repeat domain-containing protein, partial [Spirochaetes bacterium]|nr:HEAT repeat domain-containing protein [Spirochaetota bacterium]